jgi:hypothetical protein
MPTDADPAVMERERQARQETAEILGRVRALLPPSRLGRPLLLLQAGVVLALRGHEGWRLDWILRRMPLPESAVCDVIVPRIVRSFADQNFSLTIVDDSMRALRAARSTAGRDIPQVLLSDLGVSEPASLRPLRGAFDIVLSLADTADRADERERANVARNLAALTRPDGLVVEPSGLLASAPDLSLADFPAIYRRRP